MEDSAGPQAEPERDGTDAGGTATWSPGWRRAADRTGRVGARRDTLGAETLRLYAGDWGRFCEHCAAAGARALPAAPQTVAAFLQVPGAGRAARSRRLAAID